MSTQPLPELCRICILEDSRTKATFSDNTILITNSAGSTFTVLMPDGQPKRQVSEYALARHSPLLAAVLEFRNMHVDMPCFCKPLARVLRSGFCLGYVIRDATWPTPSLAVAEGLAQVQPDGKVALSSEDGVAQIVLHSHHRRFAVCYPLLVAECPQEAQYDYVWQTQVFSVASYPARWQPAVRAALHVAAHLGQAVEPSLAASLSMQDHNNLGEPPASGGGYLCASDATGGSGGHFPTAQRRTVFPRADDSTRAALAEQLSTDGWWGEPSLSLLPPDNLLVFEWTPQATYQFLPETGEVEVWVHVDESCMVSTQGGRFLQHFKEPGSGGQMYAASCVPESVWSRDQASRYPLAPLAAHALKIRSHNHTLNASLAARTVVVPTDSTVTGQTHGVGRVAATSTAELFAVTSTTIVEESNVEGHGQFTAYQDGRVRVCFSDRTILHMSASHSHCKVVVPDGHALVVAVSNPVGVERYVEAAQEFACWAFKTPEQRADELRVQARVRAEVLNSQRAAQMCEFAATGTIPTSHGYATCGNLPSTTAYPGVDACTIQEPVQDRQAMIDKLLSQNALLLQRL